MAIYRLAAKRFRVDMKQRSPQFLQALARGFGALLRYAERTLVAALKKDATINTGKARELRIRQVSVRLVPRKALAPPHYGARSVFCTTATCLVAAAKRKEDGEATCLARPSRRFSSGLTPIVIGTV